MKALIASEGWQTKFWTDSASDEKFFKVASLVS